MASISSSAVTLVFLDHDRRYHEARGVEPQVDDTREDIRRMSWVREQVGLEPELFQTVARVGEIAEGTGASFEVDGLTIAVFLDEGRYFAIDDVCPHKGIPLCDGFVNDRSVTCGWHGWRFSLEDGRWLDTPGSPIRVGTYPVRVVGDEIQVSVRDAPTERTLSERDTCQQ